MFTIALLFVLGGSAATVLGSEEGELPRFSTEAAWYHLQKSILSLPRMAFETKTLHYRIDFSKIGD